MGYMPIGPTGRFKVRRRWFIFGPREAYYEALDYNNSTGRRYFAWRRADESQQTALVDFWG